jgi:hypothetical protein
MTFELYVCRGVKTGENTRDISANDSVPNTAPAISKDFWGWSSDPSLYRLIRLALVVRHILKVPA